MGIISYRIKQHLNIYIGEVLARSGGGSLTDGILELSLISKRSQENICHHECFPGNSRIAVFRNISKQLLQLFSQTIFSHAFARHHAFLHFCVGVYFSLHHCVKRKFNPSQISKMELFVKIVNGFLSITIIT